jgi:hypothetical protein
MKSRTATRVLALSVTTVAALGLAATASGVTGAYFSDTKAGTISGTIGSVRIDTYGGTGDDDLNLAFNNLMPGEPKNVTFGYTSQGTGPQDLWLTFPNVPALHALNNLGRFGALTVTDSSSGAVFYSANLQDGRTRVDGTNSCGTFAPGGTPTNCWPLPPKLLVRSNLAPGASGSVTITFQYSSALTGTGGPAAWNGYPANRFPGGEAFGADADGPAGSGLPYRVVATQAGQTP